MTITAKVIADSISATGERITTFQVRYHRYVHGEVMTHRVFSRNASSSRAIPVKKIIADIRNDPATPVHWGQNQPGMQAFTEMQGWKQKAMKGLWLGGMYLMTSVAAMADKLGAHKQIVNRLIEPWSHINVVITATNFSNFYALRRHKDAQPEIKVLADLMWEAQQASTPKLLAEGEWHLPYIREDDREAARRYVLEHGDEVKFRTMPEKDRKRLKISTETLLLIAVSVARCARTSYHLHDGSETTFDKDFGLYQRLLGADPVHASPAEHQAMFDPTGRNDRFYGNFQKCIQYRKLLPGECQ